VLASWLMHGIAHDIVAARRSCMVQAEAADADADEEKAKILSAYILKGGEDMKVISTQDFGGNTGSGIRDERRGRGWM